MGTVQHRPMHRVVRALVMGRHVGTWRTRTVAGITLIAGALALGTVPAYAAATATATPDTGITAGQTVKLTGSGFVKNSPGTIFECNSDPNQPTVALAAPVSTSISVGCSPPSYAFLTSTSSTGTLSASWKVLGGTIGPPCGPPQDLDTCPSTDSAGKSPAADAALYPCPPTPAQQAIGDVCYINFGDQGNDNVTINILFAGESGSTTTTTTTAPASTTTTAAGGGGATTTTAASNSGASGGSGSSGSSGTSGSSGSSASSGGATASASGNLATTGPGPSLWWTFLAGLVLLNAGVLIWLGPARRRLRRTSD